MFTKARFMFPLICIFQISLRKKPFSVMHLCESWMKKHWEEQLSLNFSCNLSQSECDIHIPQGKSLNILLSLYWLPFHYIFIGILMHWVVVLFVFKLLAKLFLLPIKNPRCQEGLGRLLNYSRSSQKFQVLRLFSSAGNDCSYSNQD